MPGMPALHAMEVVHHEAESSFSARESRMQDAISVQQGCVRASHWFLRAPKQIPGRERRVSRPSRLRCECVALLFLNARLPHSLSRAPALVVRDGHG
jgi:hypothetical protein